MTAPAPSGFLALPEILPVLPLPGLLLLPETRLPLNIYEPDDIAVIDRALTLRRMIGIIQPRTETDTAPDAALYDIGCAGRITSFTETEDGRFLIGLTGLCRFRVKEELPASGSVRHIATDWSAFLDDVREEDSTAEEPTFNHARLMESLRNFFKFHGVGVDWSAIQNTTGDELIAMLAMICPLSCCEKQALLEAPTLADRAELLTSLLEMASLRGQDFEQARH